MAATMNNKTTALPSSLSKKNKPAKIAKRFQDLIDPSSPSRYMPKSVVSMKNEASKGPKINEVTKKETTKRRFLELLTTLDSNPTKQARTSERTTSEATQSEAKSESKKFCFPKLTATVKSKAAKRPRIRIRPITESSICLMLESMPNKLNHVSQEAVRR